MLASLWNITELTFENTTIHCENAVVFHGIEIDHSLTFNKRITNICKKTARQLSSLSSCVFADVSDMFVKCQLMINPNAVQYNRVFTMDGSVFKSQLCDIPKRG